MNVIRCGSGSSGASTRSFITSVVARAGALSRRGARLASTAPSMSRLSERLAAWRVKPDAATEDALAAASAPGFFLVQRPGRAPSSCARRTARRPLRVTRRGEADVLVRRRDGDARAAVKRARRRPSASSAAIVAALAPPPRPTTTTTTPRASRRCARIASYGARAPRAEIQPARVAALPRRPRAGRDPPVRARERTRANRGANRHAPGSLTALSPKTKTKTKKTTADRDSRRRDLGPDGRVRSATSPWTTSTTTPRAPATPRTARWCGAAASDDKAEENEDHRRCPTSRRSSPRRSRPDARDAGAACTRGASPCSATTASARTAEALTCPLCRCPWGELTWRPPPRAASIGDPAARRDAEARSRRIHFGVSCRACRASRWSVGGSGARCASRPAVRRVSHRAPAAHPFVAVETPGGVETDASEAPPAAAAAAAEAAEDSVSAAGDRSAAPRVARRATRPPPSRRRDYPRPNRVAGGVANGAAGGGRGARVNRGGRVASDAPPRASRIQTTPAKRSGPGSRSWASNRRGARVDASMAERR